MLAKTAIKGQLILPTCLTDWGSLIVQPTKNFKELTDVDYKGREESPHYLDKMGLQRSRPTSTKLKVRTNQNFGLYSHT